MRREKRTARLENPGNLPATSKPFYRTELDPDLLRQLRDRAREERREIGEAITKVSFAFGQPHQHAGIGVRKLRGAFFEARAGLKMRLIFETLPNRTLYFHLLGSHDEIKKFLKRR